MKLYRSVRDKKIMGVCGGLAESFNVDPTLIRLVTAATAVFSAGTAIPIYIIAGFIMPKEPMVPTGFGPSCGGGYGSGYGAAPGYGHQQPPYGGPYGGQAGSSGGYGAAGSYTTGSSAHTAHSSSPIDDAMKDLEKKAMQKEIESLKAKLSKYEKGE